VEKDKVKEESVDDFQKDTEPEYYPNTNGYAAPEVQPAPVAKKSEKSSQLNKNHEQKGITAPIKPSVINCIEDKLSGGVSNEELQALIEKEHLKRVPGAMGAKECVYLRKGHSKLYIVEKRTNSKYYLVIGVD
jgi:hypothetical protein